MPKFVKTEISLMTITADPIPAGFLDLALSLQYRSYRGAFGAV